MKRIKKFCSHWVQPQELRDKLEMPYHWDSQVFVLDLDRQVTYMLYKHQVFCNIICLKHTFDPHSVSRPYCWPHPRQGCATLVHPRDAGLCAPATPNLTCTSDPKPHVLPGLPSSRAPATPILTWFSGSFSTTFSLSLLFRVSFNIAYLDERGIVEELGLGDL